MENIVHKVFGNADERKDNTLSENDIQILSSDSEHNDERQICRCDAR